jgi:hypothetical protein
MMERMCCDAHLEGAISVLDIPLQETANMMAFLATMADTPSKELLA